MAVLQRSFDINVLIEWHKITSSSRMYTVFQDPGREVSLRVYLFAYCLNPHLTMHFTRFRQLSIYVALRQWRNWVKCIVLLLDLNNRRTGKDTGKPRALGLLRHSDVHLCISVGDRSSDIRPTPKMSPKCRPVVGRWTTDDRLMQNRNVPISNQLWIYLKLYCDFKHARPCMINCIWGLKQR